MILIHSVESLKQTFEVRKPEWGLTGAMLSLAVVFYFNIDMFYSSNFSGLREIMSDRMNWVTVFLIVGLLRLGVLIVNGAYWRTPHLRSITAFLSAGVWFLFCIGFARNGSMMIAIMPWIFWLDAMNARTAGREAGQSEYIQRYKNKKEAENAGLVEQSKR